MHAVHWAPHGPVSVTSALGDMISLPKPVPTSPSLVKDVVGGQNPSLTSQTPVCSLRQLVQTPNCSNEDLWLPRRWTADHYLLTLATSFSLVVSPVLSLEHIQAWLPFPGNAQPRTIELIVKENADRVILSAHLPGSFHITNVTGSPCDGKNLELGRSESAGLQPPVHAPAPNFLWC